MTRDEGDRLARLFERVLDARPDRRRALLDEVRRDDPRLHAKLAALLDSHLRAPDFLERLGELLLPPAVEALEADLDPVGETVGHYRVLRPIGHGGMGDVFLARDVELGRDVALKFLSPHLSSDGPAKERLKREARIASGLDHPNIAVVHEIGTAPPTATDAMPRAFIAMAYCGDETLADELARVGSLPLARVLDVALQLVDALSAAHRAGVVHRDVKPANVVVTERGSVKLVDFGLSTSAARDEGAAPGGGTVAYMSPEALAGGPVDRRTDIWAVGVLLHEMLAGAPPFQGARVDEVARAIRTEDPPSVLTTRPDTPARLAEVVERCLARDRSVRYASATALLTDLRTAAEAPAVGGRGASLVVLPFVDRSVDGSLEFLCDGFTEDVIADLARATKLRVIAGSSTRRLKGRRPAAANVALDLGVRHALEGTLRIEDGTVALAATLVDAEHGRSVWTVSMEGARDEVQRLRREVARGVLGGLGLDAASPPAAAPRRPLGHPRAYEAYLRARHEAWSFTAEGLDRARRYIDTALGIVGDDELLHGTLGHILAMHAESGLTRSPDIWRQVQRCVERVFALDPRSARGHWLRAWVSFQRGDLPEAIRAGEEAHALDSDGADVLLLLGYVYAHAGRNADARALLERALLVDPLTPLTHAVQGFVSIVEGRYADAVEPNRRAHEMDPNSPFFATFLGWALAYDGRTEEARATLGGVPEDFPGTAFASYASSLAHGLSGESGAALRAITPELEAAAESSEMFARELAHCYALAGEHDRALDHLERAVELGMWNHAYLAEHDRLLDGLRGEPRFTAILERVRAASARL